MRKNKDGESEEKKGKKGVTYAEVKPRGELTVNRNEYLAFLEIYHEIRPYLEKPNQITKAELIKKYPKRKKLIEEVMICIHELKLIWPHEMIGRIFN